MEKKNWVQLFKQRLDRYLQCQNDECAELTRRAWRNIVRYKLQGEVSANEKLVYSIFLRGWKRKVKDPGVLVKK